VDLLAVCGDFNCESDSEALLPFSDLGLTDAATLSGVQQEKTWCPKTNRLTRGSAHAARAKFQGRAHWESVPHTFDRVYLRSKKPLKKVTLQRVCDDPMLSDHFGVLAEISF
jgi:endonuclease/exonuclease/phosphatase family metal-dependent hydrolase